MLLYQNSQWHKRTIDQVPENMLKIRFDQCYLMAKQGLKYLALLELVPHGVQDLCLHMIHIIKVKPSRLTVNSSPFCFSNYNE